MTKYIWTALTAVAIVVAAVVAIIGISPVWTIAAAAVALLSLAMLVRSLMLPLRTIRNGMDLLRGQDFASTLRKVGQSDADEMVELYNALIGNMKAERLKNIEQADFLGKLIDASPMGIAICDFDGRIIEANSSFRTVLPPGRTLPCGKATRRCCDAYAAISWTAASAAHSIWWSDSPMR